MEKTISDWVFYSVLPFANKDVIIANSYKSYNYKLDCICKICNASFRQTPNMILEGRLHGSNKNCKWSRTNTLCKKNINELIVRLNIIYKKYCDKYDFCDYYTDEFIPVKLKCKKCGKFIDLLCNKSEARKKSIIKCDCHSNLLYIAKITKPKMDKRYTTQLNHNKEIILYDKDTQQIIKCQQNKLWLYIDRYNSYHSYNEIKKSKWFKKRFKDVKNTQTKKVDPELTYIKRKCDKRAICLRNNKKLCQNCVVESTPYYTNIEFDKLIRDKYPNILFYDKFKSKSEYIKCQCKTCQNVWYDYPVSILNDSHCKYCSSSKGEQIVASHLINMDVNFIKEKTFSDCIDIKPLRFDFYLNDYNAIIEFDGKQHYYPVNFNNDVDILENYEKVKKHDKIKDNFCKAHNIPLMRIKYDEKNIGKVIDDFILKLKSRNNKLKNEQ